MHGERYHDGEVSHPPCLLASGGELLPHVTSMEQNMAWSRTFNEMPHPRVHPCFQRRINVAVTDFNRSPGFGCLNRGHALLPVKGERGSWGVSLNTGFDRSPGFGCLNRGHILYPAACEGRTWQFGCLTQPGFSSIAGIRMSKSGIYPAVREG